jgi:hypothetical protein
MIPTERIEEILDRLAEMEHALPGLRERSPATAAYAVRELRLLITECSEERDRWQGALDRARTLAAEPGALRDSAPDPLA